MKLQILGCSGAEFPDFRPPAFLVDDWLLLDAGTIGSVLSANEQWRISHIFVTHSHLDHVRGIPAIADNFLVTQLSHTIQICSTHEILVAVQNYLLNDIIWPDFSRLPSVDAPVITYLEMTPGEHHRVKKLTITPIPVNHTIPAVAYLVSDGDVSILYTGDTGPTDTVWRYCSGITALIVETSFPNSMEEMALLTGHLTPGLLARELDKLPELPERILITHIKPQFHDLIRSELESLGIEQIEMLKDGMKFTF